MPKKPPSVRVNFTKDKNGKLIKLGGNCGGENYLGRAIFPSPNSKPNSRHRIVIKKYSTPCGPIQAKIFQKTITDLKKAGVKLPKMKMVKLPTGEWVKVMQLFGATKKGSKLEAKSRLRLKTSKARNETTIELTKVANAGYSPIGDLVEPFKDKSKGVLPFDLDLIANEGKNSVENRAIELLDQLEIIAKYANVPDSRNEFNRLYKLAFTTANLKVGERLVYEFKKRERKKL